MTDVFNEVDEQLRSQRYEDLLRRGWPFAAAAAAAALLVALGIWGWNRHEQDEAAKASLVYQAGMDALAKGDVAAAGKDFGEAATSGAAVYRSLGLMQEAQISLDQNRREDAVRLFDEAAKAAPDAIVADAAKLKAALFLMDTEPLADVEARLTPLTSAKSPYRTLALEALAMARLQAGKLDEAKSDFSILALSQGVSQAAQQRAQAAQDVIKSGSAAIIPAAVKAAALPPQSAAMPSAPVPVSAPQAGAAQ